jgi:hypothetical protein
MISYKNILAIVLFLPVMAIGQDILPKEISAYTFNNLKFEIINVDTVVTHHVSGEYNSPNFKQIDSTKICADIILIDLPYKIDLGQLKKKVETIMKDNKINQSYVFRDKESSILFRFSSSFADQVLRDRNGYLGQFNME